MRLVILSWLLLLCSCLQQGQKPVDGEKVPADITISLLSVNPPSKILGLSQTSTFSAVGGTPPYVFSLFSGYGTMTSDGVFTAPASAGTTMVKVTDSVQNSAFAVITTSASLLLSPTAVTVGTGETYQFNSGGGIAPYTYTLVSGDGSINSTTGLYTASVTNGSAVVKVMDSAGSFQTANVIITSALTLSPATITLEDLSVSSFSATGGLPPYTFSVYAGGGSINSATGAYTAPATAGNVIIRVRDANGLMKEANVVVAKGPELSSALSKVSVNGSLQFLTVNGAAPFTYSIYSGSGTINASGLFSAPATSGYTVVRVTDANGFIFDTTVEVFYPTRVSLGESQMCMVRVASSGLSSEAKCVGRSNYGENASTRMSLGDAAGEMGDALPEVSLGTGLTALRVYSSYNYRTCVLFSNYKMKCFGANGSGELGISTTTSFGYWPGSMGNLLPFTQLGTGVTVDNTVSTKKAVAMGTNHTCAIVNGGNLKCWGYNGYGQLGQGNGTNNCNTASSCQDNLPLINLGGETVTKVVAGGNHTCVILSPSERMKCWGWNNYGQLGRGNTSNYGLLAGETPDQMSYIDLGTYLGNPVKVKDIAAGYTHTCALLENNTLKCWGQTDNASIGVPGLGHLGDAGGEMGNALPAVSLSSTKTPKSIDSQVYSNCVVFTDNTMKCFGWNPYGQLGLGHTNHIGDNVGEMGDALPFVNVGTGETVSEVAVGYYSTCVKTNSAKTKCFGRNNEGALGLGDLVSRGDGPSEMGDNLPFVSLSSTATTLNLASNTYHQCAVLSSGKVKCWGWEGGGQTGSMGLELGALGAKPSEKMQLLPSLTFGAGNIAKDVTGNYLHNCFIMMDNTTRCFGYNSNGEFGLGNSLGNIGQFSSHQGANSARPDWGTGFTPAQFISGGHVNCMVTTDGRLKCTGYNGDGRLGLGDSNPMGNDSWETGDGIPFVATGADLVKSVHNKGSSTCALFTNNKIKCWGLNNYGQLGYEDASNRGHTLGTRPMNLPFVDLGTGRTVKQMDSGLYHSCAILDNDKVKCWGLSNYGQLGYEDYTTRGDNATEMGDNLPYVNLGTGLVPKKITLGHYHSCVMFTNNKVKCWGNENANGAGDYNRKGANAGSMGDALSFVNFGTQYKAIDLIAGGNGACVIQEDNSVKCWGANDYGHLGHGNRYQYIGMDPLTMGDNLPSW